MVALNTILIVGLIGLGIGVVMTVALVLLVVIYNNLKVVSEEVKDDGDEGSFAIPLSALGGGMGGGPGVYSMADLQRVAAQVGAAQKAATGEAPKASEGAGNYI